MRVRPQIKMLIANGIYIAKIQFSSKATDRKVTFQLPLGIYSANCKVIWQTSSGAGIALPHGMS